MSDNDEPLRSENLEERALPEVPWLRSDDAAHDAADVVDEPANDIATRRSTFTPPTPDAYDRFVSAGSGRIMGPPPSPSTAVIPPPGSELPNPPRRKSLADEQLIETLATGVLPAGDAIDALEEQLKLREQEAKEFRSWESSMVAIGTPEALGVVEETRPTFTEALHIIYPTQLALEAAPSGPPTAAAQQPSEFEAPGWQDAPPPVPRTLPEVAEPVHPAAAPDEPIRPASVSDESVHGVAYESQTGARQRAFTVESSGAEATPLDQRTGRAARLFWLWFAAHSSIVSVLLGSLLLSLGMSLRQAIIAALAGVALSFLPLGLSTLASKWSGQPTIIVSRASFGVTGNILPAVLALVTKLFWGAVVLWFMATLSAGILVAGGVSGVLTELQLTIGIAGLGFLVAIVAGFFGYTLISRIQLVLSVTSGILIVAFIALTASAVNLEQALTVGDGPWMLVVAGAILVFSVIGLVWSTSGGDLARYQKPTSSGAASMLWATVGGTLPAFVLIAYGSLLVASDSSLAFNFVVDPASALAAIVPPALILPLVAAVGFGLLSSVILSIYSGGFALQAIAGGLRREVAILIVGLTVAAAAAGFLAAGVDLTNVFRDLGTTLAVPTAAWVGIFTAEVMIRNRRFHTKSLLQRGGIYPSTRWVNLSMLIVSTVIGLGFTTASVSWLGWQGYLFELFGIATGSDFARADIGVLVALAVGLITPIVAGIRTIRRQEQA